VISELIIPFTTRSHTWWLLTREEDEEEVEGEGEGEKRRGDFEQQ
jgi:hypothetical protein